MPNTPKGFPYPAATDAVKDGAANIQALAGAVDTYLGSERSRRVIAGRVNGSGGIISGNGFTVVRNGVGTYTVSFPPFTYPPQVQVQITYLNPGSFNAPNITGLAVGSFQVVLQDAVNNAMDVAFSFLVTELV